MDCLEKNHKTHHQYIKEIEQLQTHTGDVNKIQELQEKSSIIDTTQDAILLAMQPLFNQVYDQIGEEIPPGM